MSLIVIKPFCDEFQRESRINEVLDKALQGESVRYILKVKDLSDGMLKNQKIIFAVCLSEAGINLEYYRFLEYFRKMEDCLSGSVGGIIVDGSGELYTKSLARRLAFSANLAGCTFPGKSLVEATGSLKNFNIMSKVSGQNQMEVYSNQVKDLVGKIKEFRISEAEGKKKILAIHASTRKTSNSLLLWDLVKKSIGQRAEISEISLRNGTVLDCRGCKYEDCLHFGEQGKCFYGGIMVDKVYPAIIDCHKLVLICPNYNDALSANLTAFVNRLTAVFRTNDFSKKSIHVIAISGYSGGDLISEQVIGAMNFNKSFILPGNFAMVETANNPGEILQVEHIREKAAEFADRLTGAGVCTETDI